MTTTMQLRTICPFPWFNQSQWEWYCQQGAYFTERPHYITAPPRTFAILEQTAHSHGWLLVSRTTNHNGVCPAHLPESSWMQKTMWNFIKPGHCLALQIRYIEYEVPNFGLNALNGQTPADQLDVQGCFEVLCYAEDLELQADDHLGCWEFGDLPIDGQLMDRSIDCLMQINQARLGPNDPLFGDVFWFDATTLAERAGSGQLSRFSANWAATEGLPGNATPEHCQLSYIYELMYLRHLAESEMGNHIKLFEFYDTHGSHYICTPNIMRQIYPGREVIQLCDERIDQTNSVTRYNPLTDKYSPILPTGESRTAPLLPVW
jgi:hypothetical protein